MNSESVRALGDALWRARTSATPLAAMEREWLPRDLDAAWRAQHAIWGRGPIAGWKVSGLTPAQRDAMQIPQPISSPLLAAWTRPTGGAFETGAFIAPLFECEIAFELGTDLPWRELPYTREEVIAAVRAVRPAIEIVDSRLPAGSTTLAQLADDFNNGGFVVGVPVANWQALDLAACRIELHGTAAGERRLLARGSGRAVLDGDLLGALLAMANHQCPLYGGLRAGQFVTTGTCTGAVPLAGACLAEANFESLGAVQVRLAPAPDTSRRKP
jgi:2-keto-4-pentenoate hydratase